MPPRLFTLLTAAPGIAENFEEAVDALTKTSPQILLENIKAAVIDYLPRLLGAALLLLFGHVLIKGVVKFVKGLLKRSKIDVTLHHFILGLLKNSLWVLLAVMLLLVLKVPVTPLVTILGSVGLALSLALKDSLSNIAGGISVLFNRPFAKGDLVEIKGVVGTIHAIELMYTRMRTDDDKIVYLPNGDVSKSVVVNYSSEPLKRLDFVFFIPLSSDFEKVRDIILSILKSSAYTLTQPVPIIAVNGRNEDSFSVMCKVWAKAEYFDAISATLGDEIDRRLKEAGM